VIRKPVLLVIFSLLVGSGLIMAAVTSHREYKDIKIKECNACHKGEGVAPNHLGGWNSDHRLLAQKDPNNCKDCHDQAFCQDCHFGGGIDPNLHLSTYRGNYIPRSHRSDYVEIHPIFAKDVSPQTCYRCHVARFCSDCHAQFRPQDLKPLSHRKGFSNIQVSKAGPRHSQFNRSQCETCHPKGMLPIHEWSSDHRREALRDLQACQTCHADGQVCLRCHSARQGIKVNPHPRNWSSIKDNVQHASGGKVCLACHQTIPR
jgi:hypothetical protein